jgi:GTPase SAR1 family protein
LGERLFSCAGVLVLTFEELRSNVSVDICIAVAANKCDLESYRQVDPNVAKQYADSIGALMFETSAKANKGIEELFSELTRKLIAQHKNEPATPPQDTLLLNKRDGQRSCCKS